MPSGISDSRTELSYGKKMVITAVAVSLSSIVRVDVFNDLTGGFGIALDVTVMGFLLYLFRDISPVKIIGLCAIVSPLFRMLASVPDEGLADALTGAVSDAAFFIIYGVAFVIISRVASRDDPGTFSIVIFLSDIAGNAGDILARTALLHHNAFSAEVVGLILFAAAVRTILIVLVIMSVEDFRKRRENAERLREYGMLVNNATLILDEIQIMEKNMTEVENVMKKGYKLYQDLDSGGYHEETVQESLELAKLTHEIKGDYRNVISVLRGLYDEDLLSRHLSLLDVIRLEQANAGAMIANRGYDIDLTVEADGDAEVGQSYRLMSVLRNLLTNAAEAIAGSAMQERGKITLRSAVKAAAGEDAVCIIDITDNGPGVPEGREEKIFAPGYSTKFDKKTGYIQRGLGLSIVKDYVESDMNGTLRLIRDTDRGAHFRIEIPVERISGD